MVAIVSRSPVTLLLSSPVSDLWDDGDEGMLGLFTPSSLLGTELLLACCGRSTAAFTVVLVEEFFKVEGSGRGIMILSKG